MQSGEGGRRLKKGQIEVWTRGRAGGIFKEKGEGAPRGAVGRRERGGRRRGYLPQHRRRRSSGKVKSARQTQTPLLTLAVLAGRWRCASWTHSERRLLELKGHRGGEPERGGEG